MVELSNPYLEEFEALRSGPPGPIESLLREVLPQDLPFDFTPMLRQTDGFATRHRLVGQYAFAVPTTEAIEALVALGPLVEFGAGTGYWASLVEALGGDIIAYDQYEATEPVAIPSPLPYEMPELGHYVYTVIRKGGPQAMKRHGDRTLFLCWAEPGNIGLEAVKAHHAAGGRRIAYVGEECTDGPKLKGYLRDHYRSVQYIPIPRYPNIRDYFEILERA